MWRELLETVAAIGGFFVFVILVSWTNLLPTWTYLPVFLLTFLFLTYLIRRRARKRYEERWKEEELERKLGLHLKKDSKENED